MSLVYTISRLPNMIVAGVGAALRYTPDQTNAKVKSALKRLGNRSQTVFAADLEVLMDAWGYSCTTDATKKEFLTRVGNNINVSIYKLLDIADVLNQIVEYRHNH